jgi:ubiquinone/menaquinone biosynthesis C-methylase UbiE
MAKKRINSTKNLQSKKILLKHVPNKSWDLENSSVDVIVATFVLCTQTDSQIKTLLDKMYNVLIPGGEMLFFEWFPTQSGIRGFFFKVISPFITLLFGPSAYRKPTLAYIQEDNRWKINRVYFLPDQETYALLLTKK